MCSFTHSPKKTESENMYTAITVEITKSRIITYIIENYIRKKERVSNLRISNENRLVII
nr:MAG TPA: hypothetical protein [Caudoviricetes sp.]